MNINKVKNIHHDVLFQDTCLKCNYLCSHLQVRLGEANRIVTLLFYFSHIYTFGSSASLGTLSSPSIGFNLITNFSGTRSMEIHQSGWFFRFSGSPAIWLIFQWLDWWNSINLVIEISNRSASFNFKSELGQTAFLASGTPQQWIPIEKKI